MGSEERQGAVSVDATLHLDHWAIMAGLGGKRDSVGSEERQGAVSGDATLHLDHWAIRAALGGKRYRQLCLIRTCVIRILNWTDW